MIVSFLAEHYSGSFKRVVPGGVVSSGIIFLKVVERDVDVKCVWKSVNLLY